MYQHKVKVKNNVQDGNTARLVHVIDEPIRKEWGIEFKGEKQYTTPGGSGNKFLSISVSSKLGDLEQWCLIHLTSCQCFNFQVIMDPTDKRPLVIDVGGSGTILSIPPGPPNWRFGVTIPEKNTETNSSHHSQKPQVTVRDGNGSPEIILSCDVTPGTNGPGGTIIVNP